MTNRPSVLAAVVAAALASPTIPLAAQNTAIPVAQEFERLHLRSIGPATMSGRITDFAVYEANPAIYYVATAHGGLWKTTSNGAIYEPQFQNEGLISVGDVTVSQRDPNLVWLGAGESNNRQTSSFGGGVYKSTNGGTTFQHMGLPNSRAINRIVIDPNNNDIVFVASTGSLFGPGGDRGVYKTTDGGRTWKQVLRVDDETGANDLVMAATDSRIMLASTYQRRRSARGMVSTGPGSGIWRSSDAGETWTRVVSGLPTAAMGRIGLDMYRKNADLAYALIEVGGGGRGGAPVTEDDAAGGRGGAGRGGAGGGGGTGLYRSDDGGQTWRFVSSTNPRPNYYSQVRIDPSAPDRLYLGGVGLHISLDAGRTFETDAALVTHDDIHAIWIDPSNADHVLIGSDGGVSVSYDRSRTWMFSPNLPAGLFYHVSYDMDYPYNVCGGMQDNYNWCGPSASRFGRGIANYDWFHIQGGDGFVATPDPRDSRIIYTESQNGNIIRRDKITGESKNIRPGPTNVVNAEPGEPGYRWNWDTPIVVSPITPGVLYSAANKVFRSTDRGDTWTAISPDLTNGTLTIISLAESPKQAGVIYTGSDDGAVQVTRDGGRTWTNITKNLPGISPIGYVSEVVPSRFDAGTVYVTVDGHWENDFEPHIWVSNDFGASFRTAHGNLRGENVRTLTEDTRNSDVLYIGTESGLFLTLDRGRSWRRLKANLPTVRIDELTIHPRDNALLVATHGRALWILDHLEPIQEVAAAQGGTAAAKLFSIGNALQWKYKDDRNDEWWGHQTFVGENPPIDAVIQFYLKAPVTNPMLRISDAAGARVREIAIPAARNQAGIQTVCWDMRVDPISATDNAGAGAGGGGGRGGAAGAGPGAAPVPGLPTPLPVSGYMPENPCGGAGGGGGGGGRGGGAAPGAGPHVMPGVYNVELMADGRAVERKPMRIIMDPEVRFTDATRRRYNEIVMDLHDLQRRGTPVASTLRELAGEVRRASTAIGSSTAPADVKAQFAAFKTAFDASAAKFGVQTAAPDTTPAPAGRGGGRGGGAPAPDLSAFGRVGTLKAAIMNIWELPSDALLKEYTDVKAMLTPAITEANAVVTRARTMSTTLQRHNITMRVPAM